MLLMAYSAIHKRYRKEVKQEGQYFSGGSGDLICKICRHKEKIISYLHGPIEGKEDDDNYLFGWEKLGYQCQDCGKFESFYKDESVKKCECGGTLSTESRLFCPKCKSYEVEYEMGLIT